MSVLHTAFGRYLFVSCFLMTWTGLIARAQHDYGGHGDTDPESLDIAAARERLAQDERNIAVQETTTAEFESRARKIRGQLEALALMNVENVSSRLLAFASELNMELTRLDRQIAASRALIESDKQLLYANRRTLNDRAQR